MFVQRLDRPLLLLHTALLVSNGLSAGTSERRPALSPWCRLVRDGERYLVELGGTVVTFEGRAAGALLPRLLPLLDGTRTIEGLIDDLGAPVAPAVERAVSLLDEHRLLVDGPHGSASSESGATAAAAYAVAVTRVATESDAARSLLEARVAVLGSGEAGLDLAGRLDEIGVGRVERLGIGSEPPDDAFVIAAPTIDEERRLPEINDRALRLGSAWLQVLPFDGRFVIAGPLFLPGASACHTCYVLRRGACSGYEEDFDLVHELPFRAPTPAPLVSVATGLAAVIVLRWLTSNDPTLPGRFYALEARSILRLSHHHVLRVPRCSVCAAPHHAVPSPWFEEAS